MRNSTPWDFFWCNKTRVANFQVRLGDLLDLHVISYHHRSVFSEGIYTILRPLPSSNPTFPRNLQECINLELATIESTTGEGSFIIYEHAYRFGYKSQTWTSTQQIHLRFPKRGCQFWCVFPQTINYWFTLIYFTYTLLSPLKWHTSFSFPLHPQQPCEVG